MVKKFIQKVIGAKGFRKGALRRKMGVRGESKISMASLNKKIAILKRKSAKGKLSSAELRMLREAVFARNMMRTRT